MAVIPKDPVMLLSYMNTQLRDYYSTLDECCSSLGVEKEGITAALAGIDYHYEAEKNQFIPA